MWCQTTLKHRAMPELPDILLYLHALRPACRATASAASGCLTALLRSIEPPLASVEGRLVTDLHRLGKRVVFELERDLFLVFHLMIAGRFRWKPAGAPVPGQSRSPDGLDFDAGTLIMTEAGTKRQASLYVVQGREAFDRHNPGGLEVLNTISRRLRLCVEA